MIYFTEVAGRLPFDYPHYASIIEALPQDQIQYVRVNGLDAELLEDKKYHGRVLVFADSPGTGLCDRPYKLAHVFHGLAEKGYTYENSTNRIFDLILAPGPFAKSRLIQNGIPQHKIAVVGMPKLDGLFKEKRSETKGRPRILYAPTGSWDWRSSQLWVRPEWLFSNQWDLRVSLHGCSDRRSVDKFIDMGAEFCDSHDPVTLFEGVDLLISDASSIILEFMFTGNPVIAFNTYTQHGFNPGLFNDIESDLHRGYSKYFGNTQGLIRSVPIGDIKSVITESLSLGYRDYAWFLNEIIAPEHRDGSAGVRAADKLLSLAGKA